MTDDKPQAVITSRTRAFKKTTTVFVLGLGALSIAVAVAMFVYAPQGSTVQAQVPQFILLTIGLLFAVQWALELLACTSIQIEVFPTSLCFHQFNRKFEVQLSDVLSITQREGFFRDQIVIQCKTKTYWLENLDKGYRVYDAIIDIAVNSEDEKVRSARFIAERDVGGVAYNERVGSRSTAGEAKMTAESSFLRYVLSGPAAIYLVSACASAALTWLLYQQSPFPFFIDGAALSIMVCMALFFVFTAAYTFYEDEKLLVYPDRISIQRPSSELTIHKDDVRTSVVKRHFATRYVRLFLKNGSAIDLRGYSDSKAINDSIQWSDLLTSTQERVNAVKKETARNEMNKEIHGYAISLEKLD